MLPTHCGSSVTKQHNEHDDKQGILRNLKPLDPWLILSWATPWKGGGCASPLLSATPPHLP